MADGTRIPSVLADVAMHPATAWRALLLQHLGDDPSLVEQALAWLHANERRNGLSSPSLGPTGDARYTLAVQLDIGATASVWQAHDKKLGRDVAIKVFHDGASAGVSRVIAEARAACEVISDHTVRILDVHDGPSPYIVMELVGEHDPERGQLALGTSASTCRPRTLDEVVRWVLHVARGVHDAHLRNVFHRDLKPHNVVITPITRHARITDFGLAVSTASEHGAGLFGEVTITGTPEYMAPEQARGLRPDLDPRCSEDRRVLVGIDVWGLGALAYALLAGRPPWQPASDLEAWELAASGATPPPIARTSCDFAVPRRLARIIDKALSIDPRQRYGSAAEVALELEALLARRPTSFDRARVMRAGLWCRRNPQLSLSAVVTAALVLVMLGANSTVARLRGERSALGREVAEQQAELQRLMSRVREMRTRVHGIDQPDRPPHLAAGRSAAGSIGEVAGRTPSTTGTRRPPRQPRERETIRAKARRGRAPHHAAATSREPATGDRDQREAARAVRALRRQRDQAIAERDRAREELAAALDELAITPDLAPGQGAAREAAADEPTEAAPPPPVIEAPAVPDTDDDARQAELQPEPATASLPVPTAAITPELL